MHSHDNKRYWQTGYDKDGFYQVCTYCKSKCYLPKDLYKGKKHWEPLDRRIHDVVRIEDKDIGWWMCSNCLAKLTPV